MLPIPNLIVISSISILGLGFFITIFFVLKSKTGLWGEPSIAPVLFYSGKISMYICWGLALIKAIFPKFGGDDVPIWMTWPGAILFAISSVILLITFYDLGSSLKYGLPDKDTRLVKSGLYRFSRHPLYVGVFLISFSSVIFFPNIINILVAAYCCTTHYFMIIEEDNFLATRFGAEWEEYKNQVGRFL